MSALVFRGGLAGSIFHQFNTKHQTFASGVADDAMFSGQFEKSLPQMIADMECILLKTLAINHSKHRASLRTDDRIPAESVDVDSRGQRVRNFGRGHHRSQRCAVGNALRHRYDIWDDVVRFKPPIMRSGPSKSTLNFVRDADATRRAHMLVSGLQIAVRKHDRAADSLNGLGDKGRHPPRSGVLNQVQYV